MIFNIELPKKLNKFNYFKKEEKGCRLYSYNGNIGNNYYIIVDYPELEIEKDFTVVDSTLNAIIKLGNETEVKLNDKTIVAVSKNGKYTGKYVESNFAMPLMNYNNSCGIDLNILVKATQFASNNEKKPILTGVYVDENSNVVATDSFKVYKYDGGKGEVKENTESIVISAPLIKLADSIFENKLLFVSYNKNSFCIKDNNVMLVGNLLDGNYPSVSAIFNQINAEANILNKEEVLQALEFTKIAGANQDLKKTSLYAILQNNKFIGEGDEKFEKEINYNGDEVVFDAFFLETVLKSIDSKEIMISTLRKGKGSMSKFTSNEKSNEQIVLMGIARETE